MKKLFGAIIGLLVSFSALSDSVTLQWDASTTPTVTGYNLYEAKGNVGPFTMVSTLGNVTTVTRNITELSRYYVTAFNANGESPPSNIITYTPVVVTPTLPAAPTNLRVSVITQARLDLHWDRVSSGTDVLVERGLSTTGFSQVGVVPFTQSYYISSGLRKNRTYYFRVRSKNSAGVSNYSPIVSATPGKA